MINKDAKGITNYGISKKCWPILYRNLLKKMDARLIGHTVHSFSFLPMVLSYPKIKHYLLYITDVYKNCMYYLASHIYCPAHMKIGQKYGTLQYIMYELQSERDKYNYFWSNWCSIYLLDPYLWKFTKEYLYINVYEWKNIINMNTVFIINKL